jgi:hypothetical protein
MSFLLPIFFLIVFIIIGVAVVKASPKTVPVTREPRHTSPNSSTTTTKES